MHLHRQNFKPIRMPVYTFKPVFRLLLVGFLLSTVLPNVLAQELDWPAIESMNDELTKAHQRIPGTKVQLLWPEGYRVVAGRTSLEGPAGQVVAATVVSRGNFWEAEKGLNRQDLQARRMRLIKLGGMNVQDYPAKYAYFQGADKSYGAWIMFGDSSFVVSVVAVVPEAQSHEIPGLIETLKTIHYDRKTKVNPMELAVFEADTVQTDFRLKAAVGSSYVYISETYQSNITIAQLEQNQPIKDTLDLHMKLIDGIRAEMVQGDQSTTTSLEDAKYLQSSSQRTLESITRIDMAGKNPSWLLIQLVHSPKHTLVFNALLQSDGEKAVRETRDFINRVRIKRSGS